MNLFSDLSRSTLVNEKFKLLVFSDTLSTSNSIGVEMGSLLRLRLLFYYSPTAFEMSKGLGDVLLADSL